MEKRIGYLSVEDIFRDLDPQERQEVERSLVETTFRRGEVIYTPEGEKRAGQLRPTAAS